MERDLKFCLCGNPSEKQIRKSGLIVYRGICSTCLTLKRRNIPDYVNKDWLYNKHIIENLSLEQIATELNIKDSHCLHLFRIYNIEEIKHCKYCNATENLRQCKVNNKWMNEKEAVHKICQSCYGKMKSEKQKEAVKKIDFEEAGKKYRQHYINNPDKKKLETEKANKTKANKPEDIKQAEIERMRQTKLSKSDEEKQGIIEKFKETMNNKTDEEKQLRLERMGKGVSKAYHSKPQEEHLEILKRRRDNFINKYGVPYNPSSLEKLYERNKNKTEEEKKLTSLKKSVTMLSKTKEEKEKSNHKKLQHYIDDPTKRIRQVQAANNTKKNRTEAEKQLSVEKYRKTMKSRTKEERDQTRKAKIDTFIKNDSFPHKNGKPAVKAEFLFSHIDQFFNYELDFRYNLFDKENKKYIKREKAIYVEDLKLSKNTCRFFDFYFKDNNREVVFEFDEIHHNSNNTLQNDIIREKEIFIKKPLIELYRIKEEYFDNNYEELFNDIINIIKNKDYIPILNYDSLTKQKG